MDHVIRAKACLLAVALFTILFGTEVAAQDTSRIAAYVTGGDSAVNKAFAVGISHALDKTERFTAIEQYETFLDEISADSATAASDSMIIDRAKQAGAGYVCFVTLNYALGSYLISARIVDALTGEAEAGGLSDSPLQTLSDLIDAAENVVRSLRSLQPEEPPPPAVDAQPPVAAIRPEYDLPAPSEPIAVTPPQEIVYADVGHDPYSLPSNEIVHSPQSVIDHPHIPPPPPVTVPAYLTPTAQNSAPAMRTRQNAKARTYLALKWMPPVTPETECGWAFDIEIGRTWGDGWFWAIDVGFGLINDYGEYSDRFGLTGGYNFSMGHSVDLGGGLQFAYGLSIGPWVAVWERYNESDYYGDSDSEYMAMAAIGGPIVKLRWHILEATYRGLLGFGGEDGPYGHAYISQLMLGFYFKF